MTPLKVTQLNRDMLDELKARYLSVTVDREEHRSVSERELQDADELVSDETIFAKYANAEFTVDNFICTARRYDIQDEIERKETIKGLKEMKVKYDLLQSEPEIGNEGERAEAIGKAIEWFENPKSMASIPEYRFNEVYDTLKMMKVEAGEKRDRYLKVGHMDAPIMDEYFPLNCAVDKLPGDYHYHQTVIQDVLYPDDDDEYRAAISYRQGNIQGSQLIEKDSLSYYRKEEFGYEMSNKDIINELLRREGLELTDLSLLPYYSEVSPAMLKFYDDIRGKEPMEAFYTEDEVRKLCCSEDGVHKSPKDVCEELKADIELYPFIRNSIDIDPLNNGSFDVKFLDDFRTCISDSLDGSRNEKMSPIRGDIPGEEIFGQIEKALDAAAGRDPHGIPRGGEADRELREVLRNFENFSGQEALVSLKHEAEAKDVRKGSTVLHGALKYETQKDRKDAYKWVKDWMDASVNELNRELHKMQEKGKGQGR